MLSRTTNDIMKSPKPNGIVVQLDYPERAYFPGEVVSGKLTVFQSALLNYTSTGVKVTVQVEGKASIFSGGRTAATEQYLNKDICLFENDNFRTTPAEDTTFAFHLDLPPNLPTSFSSKLGQLLYTITGKLESQDSKKSHYSYTVPFFVNGLVDLNRYPRISEKVTFSKAKTGGCFWGKNGPVGFKVTIPRAGYIPGESIQLSVEMTNTSKHQVKSTAVQLIQTVLYHYTPSKVKSKQSTIGEESGPGITSGEYTTWACSLTVPQTPSSGLSGCKIIDVTYKLHFHMDLGGLHSKVKADTPILIGSIPIRTNSPELVPIDMIRSQLLRKIPSDVETEMANSPPLPGSPKHVEGQESPSFSPPKRVSFAVQDTLSSQTSSDLEEISDEETAILPEHIEQHEIKPVSNSHADFPEAFDLLDFSTDYVRVFRMQTSILVY